MIPPIDINNLFEIRPTNATLELIVSNAGQPCLHKRSNVDAGLRAVSCADCGAELCAFDVLLKVATHHQKRHEQLMELAIRIKATTSRLEQIKRLESNARARVKRLVGQDELDVIVRPSEESERKEVQAMRVVKYKREASKLT